MKTDKTNRRENRMKKIGLVLVLLVSAAAVFALPLDRESAYNEALDYAAVSSDDVRYSEVHRDREDRRAVWEIELVTSDAEWDFELDHETGALISAKKELRHSWNDCAGAEVTEDEAYAAALADAGVTDPISVRMKSDRDRGQRIYEFEFTTNEAYYDYEVSRCGHILSASVDYFERPYTDDDVITYDEAVQLVLDRVKGADADSIRMVQSNDDGRMIWEGELYHDGYEYEFELDASSGRFTDWERDRVRY